MADIMEDEIYPLVIIRDRYTGVYSGGKYTAWSGDVEDILPPPEVNDDDVICMNFCVGILTSVTLYIHWLICLTQNSQNIKLNIAIWGKDLKNWE